MTRFKSLVQSASSATVEQNALTPSGVGAPGLTQQTLDWPATYCLPGLQDIKSEDWSLNTTGLVEKPTRFVYRNILALPQTTQERRWISADGWSVKASWQGVLLEELVKRIHPDCLKPDASEMNSIWVTQTNSTGEKEFLALKDLLSGQALLCHTVNGMGLPWLYGGPVALMVFDRYSYKGLGQISELSFESTAPEAPTTHQYKGYPVDGTIAPGDYYAFDLQAFRPLHGPEQFSP